MMLLPPEERQSTNPLSDEIEALSEIATPAVAAATSFQQHTIESMAACQTDWIGFLNLRWHENMGLASQLIGCHSPLEIQTAYFGYWVRAAEQYSKEYQRLNAIVRADGLPYRHVDSLRELRG